MFNVWIDIKVVHTHTVLSCHNSLKFLISGMHTQKDVIAVLACIGSEHKKTIRTNYKPLCLKVNLVKSEPSTMVKV